MGLSDQQIEQFKTKGFVACPEFFNAREVKALQSELSRLRAVGAFNNVSTDNDGKTTSSTKMNLQICPLYPHSTLFRALPFHPKVLQTIPQLIGDPILLHLDQVFLKPARHGSGTNWHQDNAYFQLDNPLHGTAMWIAVHPANVANGTLRVIPDMQFEKLPHQRDPQSNHHIRCWPDESRAEPVELPAGGVVFFCYGTPHSTGANNTDADRAGVAYHFLTEASYGTEQAKVSKAIGTILTGPRASGGEKEYATRVAGAWDAEVEKANTDNR